MMQSMIRGACICAGWSAQRVRRPGVAAPHHNDLKMPSASQREQIRRARTMGAPATGKSPCSREFGSMSWSAPRACAQLEWSAGAANWGQRVDAEQVGAGAGALPRGASHQEQRRITFVEIRPMGWARLARARSTPINTHKHVWRWLAMCRSSIRSRNHALIF